MTAATSALRLPYLLAAGWPARSRLVGAPTTLAKHRPAAFMAVEDIQRGQGEVMEYLSDMDIDPLISSTRLLLTPTEIYLPG
jgi:hypothetical protein